MKLTYDHLNKASFSGDIGFLSLNSYQFRLLGIGWPPKAGWVKTLVGHEVDPVLWSLVMELKNVKKKGRKPILKKYGLTPRRLFQSPTGSHVNLCLPVNP